MSSAIVASFDYATQQLAIYTNFFNIIIGIPGGLLNIIVFLSLKTFRESTCSFYLIILSFFNIGQLVTGSLTRLLISGYGVDLTTQSRFYCKFRIYLFQAFSLITLTCLCLATMDQYFATCTRIHWQQWSNIKLVRILSFIAIVFWSIFAIIYPFFYDIIISTNGNKTTCTNTNYIFQRYNSYFHQNIMQGFLPNCLTALFAILAHRNLKNLAYRTVPLVRRELDKQLTTMLLVQVVVNSFSLLCYNVVGIVTLEISAITDSIVLAKIRFVQVLSYSLYYFYPACPFYIYICVSNRFRRQLGYVFIEKYFNHCPKLRLVGNEVVPQI
ncbi:hypothetical protein I4U23_030752 [Adineta vaga]|nr:hypothetical protein I4U23_030752 [Adineta vaga]